MNKHEARILLQRLPNIPLYLHAYSYHLNMRLERILPHDLLDIAKKNDLAGVKIHVLDGESQSLGQLDEQGLLFFKSKALALGLDVHIETSSSEKQDIDHAVAIATKVGASSVRFYPRYEGHLQHVLQKVLNDILYMASVYEDSGISFTIEQHEDLNSQEIMDLIEKSGMKNLSILFDFANMVNANELPLDALRIMKSRITQVHMKDALVTKEKNGFGHKACRSGAGDMPFKELLQELILLGEKEPQVTAYGLEEEVDYYAPAFRFDGEGDNPWIPWRQMSETVLPESNVDARLEQEKEDALAQLTYVRATLKEIQDEALLVAG